MIKGDATPVLHVTQSPCKEWDIYQSLSVTPVIFLGLWGFTCLGMLCLKTMDGWAGFFVSQGRISCVIKLSCLSPSQDLGWSGFQAMLG